MLYLWIKALHVVAVVTWVAGMLTTAIAIAASAASRREDHAPRISGVVAAVRKWDRRVTTPAMLLVWALGLTLAYQGGWFGAPWLSAKLVLVFLLSAAHGLLSGNLRRLAWDEELALRPLLRRMPTAVLALAFGIVSLVVVKPW